MGTPVSPQEQDPEGLISVPMRIHWPATDSGEGGETDTDRVIIQNFLNTLAEVALAVAARRERAPDT